MTLIPIFAPCFPAKNFPLNACRPCSPTRSCFWSMCRRSGYLLRCRWRVCISRWVVLQSFRFRGTILCRWLSGWKISNWPDSICWYGYLFSLIFSLHIKVTLFSDSHIIMESWRSDLFSCLFREYLLFHCSTKEWLPSGKWNDPF